MRPVEREGRRADVNDTILVEDRGTFAVADGVAYENVGPRLVAEELRAGPRHVQHHEVAEVLNRAAVVAGRVGREQTLIQGQVAAGRVEDRAAVQRGVHSERIAVENERAVVVVQRTAVSGRVVLQQAVVQNQLGRGLVVDRSAVAVEVVDDSIDRRIGSVAAQGRRTDCQDRGVVVVDRSAVASGQVAGEGRGQQRGGGLVAVVNRSAVGDGPVGRVRSFVDHDRAVLIEDRTTLAVLRAARCRAGDVVLQV